MTDLKIEAGRGRCMDDVGDGGSVGGGGGDADSSGRGVGQCDERYSRLE